VESYSVSRSKFNLFTMFSKPKPETENIGQRKEMKAKYSASEIMYQPFGRVFYRIIKNNTVQQPGIIQIEYIPKDLNDTLDRMVAEYNEEQLESQEDERMLSSTQPDKSFLMTGRGAVEVEVDEGVLDPLEFLNQQPIEPYPNSEESPEDFIFIHDDEPKAKTQSDVIDSEDDEEFVL